MEIKIESGIPIPGHRGERSKISEALRKLEIGQSIFIPGKRTTEIAGFLTNARRLESTKNFKFTCRTMDGGCRVWRIE